METRLALLAVLTTLSACSGRHHDQVEGCYAIRAVQPAGVLRDDCQLLGNAASVMSSSFSFSGDIVAMSFRMGSATFGTLLDMSMAGKFNFGEEKFGADGTAANVLLPIEGMECSVERTAIHIDATTNPSDAQAFSGLMTITTFTTRPQQCVCTAWFEYLAHLSSDPTTCS
jgi:hypothetical protein